MAKHFFRKFVGDQAEHQKAVAHWTGLWSDLSEFNRNEFGWRIPWFESAYAELDGNPIFTAVSDQKLKAIRVIQYEPTSQDVEFDWWFDTFGGGITDPFAIRELVIACAPSVETDSIVRQLMTTWISGEIEMVRGNDLEPFVVREASRKDLPAKFYDFWTKAA